MKTDKELVTLNKVQMGAFDLVRADARFIYTITDIHKNAKNLQNNYVSMFLPYLGVITDGINKWGEKVGFKGPNFNEEEREFYADVRNKHKLFDLNLNDYLNVMNKKFEESDNYFYKIRGPLEFYYNVGVDVYRNRICGNTVLCSMYLPYQPFSDESSGPWLMKMAIKAGEIASFYGCKMMPLINYDKRNLASTKDFHFFKNCPLKIKNELGFLLFNIVCSINYVIEFIEKFFIEEIPQKLKFAYLQYYYLTEFVREINLKYCLKIKVDNSLMHRKFRNCIAHYGLGAFMSEKDIIENDVLKGLTHKAFGEDYFHTKEKLFTILTSLRDQIEIIIFD